MSVDYDHPKNNRCNNHPREFPIDVPCLNCADTCHQCQCVSEKTYSKSHPNGITVVLAHCQHHSQRMAEYRKKMSNSIQPYRTEDSIEKASPTGPEVGLLRAKRPAPPHKCSPPGLWGRFFLWLTFRTIYPDSLWRCPICKEVKEWSIWGSSNYHWQGTTTNKWTNAGGYIKPEESK
jgi:hypothetical protein